MDPLPMPLFGPEPEIVVAGLPVGKVIGHHPPRAAGTENVENAVENVASGVLPGTAPHRQRTGRQKRSDELPFQIVEAAWVVGHSELLPDPNTKVQPNKCLESFFRQPLSLRDGGTLEGVFFLD